MTVNKAKYILSLVAGLLVAFAVGDLRAALKVADAAGLMNCQSSDGDGFVGRIGDGVSVYLSEVLKSDEVAGSREMRMATPGSDVLSPLFPVSSGPADDSADPQINIVPAPISGAGAIPASVNTSGPGSGGCALGGELVSLVHIPLQSALPAECKTIVPKGPPNRWFRPPRQPYFGDC